MFSFLILLAEHINLKIKEDRDSGKGIYIQGAAEEYVTCAEEVFELMRTGAANRVTSSTSTISFAINIRRNERGELS
jgi:kinesin family protein 5